MKLKKQKWGIFEKKFEEMSYFNFEKEKKEPSEEKLTSDLKQTNTWKCPVNRLNPDILNMLFDLNKRMEDTERKIKEPDLQTVKNPEGELDNLFKDYQNKEHPNQYGEETDIKTIPHFIKEYLERNKIIKLAVIIGGILGGLAVFIFACFLIVSIWMLNYVVSNNLLNSTIS